MKVIVNIVRIIVGVLFIFSGLVKANDPIGLSYKMQEFFDVWGMSFLNSFSLTFSILIIAFEIIAGAALLLGWKTKLINWLLLILIIFFTFLTGYAYLSGKFKSCGCFGDCIPITSGMSFIKDIILLVLIIFLFINHKYIRPIFSKGITFILLIFTVIFSFAAQWYTLHYLPVADCLPFKKGNNIGILRTIPNNAIPDSTVITFVYEKEGKKVEFSADKFPDDFNEDTYKFIDRYDKVIKPGWNNTPPIKGFVLHDDKGTDITDEILREHIVLLLFVEDATRPVQQWQSQFDSLYKAARERFVPVYAVTSKRQDLKNAISNTSFKDIPILDADRTMIRTAARTNPTAYIIKEAVIAGKWSYKNFIDGIRVLPKPSATPELVVPPAKQGPVMPGDTISF